MEIRLLRYFWVVAEEKNFSRAAQVLNVTQPTLSRQIKDLEETIGTPLFERGSRELQLTEDGLFLKERAEEILQLNAKLEKDFLDRQNKELSGSFSIGCVEADNSDTVAMMLEEVLADHPQVSFDLVTGTSDEISDKLEKGILDLAVLLEPVTLNAVESLRLPREEKWGFLVSSSSFAAQQDCITPADILGMPLLLSKRKEVRELLSAWAKIPVEDFNVIGTYNLIFNVFALVENRVGSAFAIEGAISNRKSEGTKFVPLMPEVKTNCVLVWKKRMHTPVVEEVIRRFKYAFKA